MTPAYRLSTRAARARDRGRLPLAAWCSGAIRDVRMRAAEDARHQFHVQPDASFDLDVAWVRTQPSA